MQWVECVYFIGALFRLSAMSCLRMPGDVAGIKRYSEAMNAGDAYPLFAAMLTYKTWDTISGATNIKTEAENGGNGKPSVSSTSSSMLDVDRLKVTAYVESADENTAGGTTNQKAGSGVKADPMLQHYAALYAQEIAKILSKIPRFAFIEFLCVCSRYFWCHSRRMYLVS